METSVRYGGITRELPTYRIADLPTEDKPREKLAKYGSQVLTLQELLMIIFGRGTRKEDVVSMAHRVIRDYGENILTSNTHPSEIAHELDIPETHAMQIVACAEIGKRLFGERPCDEVLIQNASDVYAHVHAMRSLPKEHLKGLYMNARNQIIHEEVLSIGTVNSSSVHPREVYRPAITYAAVAVILVHNHPSGSVLPSEEDIVMTRQIQESGNTLGIPLLDHVIVSDRDYHSMLADTN